MASPNDGASSSIPQKIAHSPNSPLGAAPSRSFSIDNDISISSQQESLSSSATPSADPQMSPPVVQRDNLQHIAQAEGLETSIGPRGNAQNSPSVKAAEKPKSPGEKSTGGGTAASSSGKVPFGYIKGTRMYRVETVTGLSEQQFRDLIKTFPDGGTGLVVLAGLAFKYHNYGTYLTPTQAAEIRKNPLVADCDFDSPVDPNGPEANKYKDEFSSIIPPRNRRRMDTNSGPNPELDQQPGSPDHLKLVSQGPINAKLRASGGRNIPPIPEYNLMKTAGQGVTIFSIDTGINPNHPEFQKSYDPKFSYIVPNMWLGLPEFEDATGQRRYVPESDTVMKDVKEHGTCVASLATGITMGVAKKARLVPIRIRNTKGIITSMGIIRSFEYMFNLVKETNAGKYGQPPPLPGWAVLSFSGGFNSFSGYGDPNSAQFKKRRQLMQVLLQDCWDLDIVTVFAAGNEGEDNSFDLSQDIPSFLGKATNPLITVGGCAMDGSRAPHTTHDKGNGGSITIDALSVAVQCASSRGGFQSLPGTSMATPIVAGLAAYYLSLGIGKLPHYLDGALVMPPSLHTKGKVAQAVKDYLAQMGHVRNPALPNSYKVAYNGVEESVCKKGQGAPVAARSNLRLRGPPLAQKPDQYGLIPSVCSCSASTDAKSQAGEEEAKASPATANSGAQKAVADTAKRPAVQISNAPAPKKQKTN